MTLDHEPDRRMDHEYVRDGHDPSCNRSHSMADRCDDPFELERFSSRFEFDDLGVDQKSDSIRSPSRGDSHALQSFPKKEPITSRGAPR